MARVVSYGLKHKRPHFHVNIKPLVDGGLNPPCIYTIEMGAPFPQFRRENSRLNLSFAYRENDETRRSHLEPMPILGVALTFPDRFASSPRLRKFNGAHMSFPGQSWS